MLKYQDKLIFREKKTENFSTRCEPTMLWLKSKRLKSRRLKSGRLKSRRLKSERLKSKRLQRASQEIKRRKMTNNNKNSNKNNNIRLRMLRC